MIGQTISHYRILEKLGEGGMGVVYKAHDEKLHRDVALKFLPQYLTTDKVEQERFLHEARAAATLNHSNITTIYEVDEHDGLLFLAMELVEGDTLRALMNKGILSVEKALDTMMQASEGLAAAHEKGIVHRDIKPENILLTAKGHVKITDFGLAKMKGTTRLTKSGLTLGTIGYMSPEQTRGEELDHRSDIFSLGVVLYEMLTGQRAFRGEHQAAIAYSITSEDPQPIARFNNKVTPELERIVFKALSKDRDERYQHADDMLADLRHERKRLDYAKSGYVKASQITTTPPLVIPTSAPAETKRKPILWASLGAVALMAIALLSFDPFKLRSSDAGTQQGSKNVLAVLYFENLVDREDKDYLGEMMTNLLITALSQSQNLEVISRERLYDIQKELGETNTKTIAPSLATQIALRAGAGTMLLGSVLQAQPTMTVTTRLIEVQSGRILKSQRMTGIPSSQIFTLVDSLALQIQADLNVGSAGKEVKSVAEVTTKSLEAYRAYVEGVELDNRQMWPKHRAAFRRVVELDSTFAVAHLWLGNIKKAWELRDRVTERERLLIEAAYEKKPAKRVELLESMIQKYPHEQRAHFMLARGYLELGQYDDRIFALERGLKMLPQDRRMWNELSYTYSWRGRRNDAMNALQSYLAVAPAEAGPCDTKGEIHLFFGEVDSAVHWFRLAESFEPGFSSDKLGAISLVRQQYADAQKYLATSQERILGQDAEVKSQLITIYQGRLRESRDHIREIVVLSGEQFDSREILTMINFELRDHRSMLEDARILSDSLKKNPNDKIYGRDLLAFAYLKTGNKKMYDGVMKELQSALEPENRGQLRRYKYIEALRAYEEGAYQKAVEIMASLTSLTRLVRVAPNYFLAVSHLRAGNLPAAIDELNRLTWWIPTSDGWEAARPLATAWYWPIAAVKAHYWLGVAYEQQGNKQDAIRSYEKFLEIWKDADFESPELKDAKTRLTKLRGLVVK
jgi:tetratricopeptide (TPR) repeat protein/tRNA A-37 threonylcarbamoyl transferase component Bud32